MRFAEVTLSAPLDLGDFYGGVLGLPLDGEAIVVGETRLRFRVEDRGAFYHFAFLVPGDRFDAALVWVEGRVELLGEVFDFDNWDASAVYFHDPAGNIVELIAHHGLDEDGRSGEFAAEELVGFSELGLVGDPPELLRRLETRGLELWDGEVEGGSRLGFVGEKGRTLILAPPGRGWLPTGRPAEPHPVATTVSDLRDSDELVTVCYLLDPEAVPGEQLPPEAASNRLLLG
jgi:catechol 2,3-dioxygenase-like lactoylglutathione lyase family enzyme